MSGDQRCDRSGYSLALGRLLLLLIIILTLWSGRGNSNLLLGVSVWHDLGVGWESEVLDEVLDTGVGEEVVGPSPVVDLVEESSGLEGFNNHHDVEVWELGDLSVNWQVSILLDDDDTLSEEVFEQSSSFFS